MVSLRSLYRGETIALIAIVSILFYWLLYPVLILSWHSFFDNTGNYTGFSSFLSIIQTPGLKKAIWNTLSMGGLVTLTTVTFAFTIAFGVARTCFFGRRVASFVCLLPLFAPSLFPAVGLMYLFGNQGICKWLFGETSLYGSLGVYMGSVLFCLPHAIILCSTTLRSIDANLYESARTLGAGSWRQFLTITLPHARYGLISAALVVFILTITDFGVPKVLGGDYSMLATEIYKQVIGMQNFSLGAAISVVLMVPSACAFIINSWARKKQRLLFHSGVFYTIPPFWKRDLFFTFIIWGIIGAVLIVFGVVVWGSFIRFWPYDLSMTLMNYDFSSIGESYKPFSTSLLLACYAALLGTLMTFLGTYTVERCQQPKILSGIYRALALLPLSIPGTVLGLAYLFTFNKPGGWYAFFYGSMIFLAINTVIHFYTVGYLAFSAALQSINPNYESVGFTLGVGRFATFFRIIAPLSIRSLLEVSMYIFVNALTTISAVVFLYTPDILPASVFMLQINETGNTAAAAAVGTGLLFLALTARLGYAFVFWLLSQKNTTT